MRIDGLEVLRTVKSDPSLRAIPIVMLTSSREEADVAHSHHLGANAYVVKPPDFQQFVIALREVASFGRLSTNRPRMSPEWMPPEPPQSVAAT